MTNDLRKVSVAILAGGLGTRLKLIEQQKVVAKVGDHPSWI